ncbi:MAG: hypothetical protein J7L82_00820 [Staphylothermus sp.]|nr:hypothetical protein [Staphylothermus sp.]
MHGYAFKEFEDEARKLRAKKIELEKEYIDFFTRFIKFLLDQGVENLFVLGYYDEKENGKKVIDEGIIIENKKPYYVNKNTGLKIELKNDEDIEMAISDVFGDLLLLENPLRPVNEVKEQLGLKKRKWLWSLRFKR